MEKIRFEITLEKQDFDCDGTVVIFDGDTELCKKEFKAETLEDLRVAVELHVNSLREKIVEFIKTLEP